MMTPMLNVIGKSKNALLWYFFSLIISEIIVRITPMFPFNTPPNNRNATAMPKLCENPNPRMLHMVPNSPMQIAFFRPPCGESANLPQSIAVKN